MMIDYWQCLKYVIVGTITWLLLCCSIALLLYIAEWIEIYIYPRFDKLVRRWGATVLFGAIIILGVAIFALIMAAVGWIVYKTMGW